MSPAIDWLKIGPIVFALAITALLCLATFIVIRRLMRRQGFGILGSAVLICWAAVPLAMLNEDKMLKLPEPPKPSQDLPISAEVAKLVVLKQLRDPASAMFGNINVYSDRKMKGNSSTAPPRIKWRLDRFVQPPFLLDGTICSRQRPNELIGDKACCCLQRDFPFRFLFGRFRVLLYHREPIGAPRADAGPHQHAKQPHDRRSQSQPRLCPHKEDLSRPVRLTMFNRALVLGNRNPFLEPDANFAIVSLEIRLIGGIPKWYHTP